MTKEDYIPFTQQLLGRFFEDLPSRVLEKHPMLKKAKPSDYVLNEEVMSEVYHEGDTVTLTLVYRRVTE